MVQTVLCFFSITVPVMFSSAEVEGVVAGSFSPIPVRAVASGPFASVAVVHVTGPFGFLTLSLGGAVGACFVASIACSSGSNCCCTVSLLSFEEADEAAACGKPN